MPVHTEVKRVPFTPDQMFDLVADIEKYPDFLPWCDALRIRTDDVTDGTGVRTADMVIGFKMIRERFRSRVVQDASARTIDAHFLDGPFKKLVVNWRFTPLAGETGTDVHFRIDYEFKHRLLEMAANQFVDFAFLKLSGAFVERAGEVYGGSA